MRLRSFAILLVLPGLGLGATADQILGTWLTANGASKIEIKKCGDRYCGAIAWMRDPKNDTNNPDPALRGRPLVSVEVLSGLRFDAQANAWTGGKLYGPERGKTVNGKAILTGDDTLEVQASAGLVKRTVIWKRAK